MGVDLGAPDLGPADTGAVDMGPADTGAPDLGPPDLGTPDMGPPDMGLPMIDTDNDGILDIHEGNGQVDTDGDGTPDTQDTDSDNDGIPDANEAGDTNPQTVPIDTDGDGTPDFQDPDADGDGIDDVVETTADPDGDGIPNFLDLDSDGDNIPDLLETAADADGDGTPNFLDLDSDGDGLQDIVEAGTPVGVDSDFDGIPNFLDLDSDNDFISDGDEGLADPDGDGLPNYLDIDSDGDFVLDRDEVQDTDLNTPAEDADTDGTPDYLDLDSDGDTILDAVEGLLDTDGDGTPDRLDLDSDGDGWLDADEAGDADLLTAPINSDGDALPDFRDLDSDGDALADALEPGCPLGSSRVAGDSDNDTFLDPAEVAFGSDPCDPNSIIDDFYFVLPELGPGANAPLLFSNTNIDRADLAINMDTTGSMQGEINNLQATLSNTIIPSVNAQIADTRFAVSSFEDYPINPFGDPNAGDIPFRLGTRVTSDAAVAQAAVNALTTRSGFDFPESGMEALYQIATGVGTTWAGGSVPAFNPANGQVAGVADGTIGGVGFRTDALPIVVHVTDSISHTRRDYISGDPSIGAADVATARAALSGIGARVVSISSGLLPFNDLLCSGGISTFFGAITPLGGDVDWFELSGAQAGDTVDAEVLAQGFLSTLDPMVAIANSTGIIASLDDNAANDFDANLSATLTGTGPFYVAVSSTGDNNFTGIGTTTGHYLVNLAINGASLFPSPTECRLDDGDDRVTATPAVANAVPPADQAACQANCDMILGPINPLFADFTFPYEMSQDTGAVIPTCAWDEFGQGRPAACAVGQCCTGPAGAGVAPDANGTCPLAFEIDDTGAGLDQAMVAGIEALVNFSTFTITTQVRGDPVELQNSGIDTACFIHGVIPTTATPPNACVPTPVPDDLLPPVGELDSFRDVAPGTQLEFQVNALNQVQGGAVACAPAMLAPQQFTAFIDVIADGVTVVDTRQVIIIVPPAPPQQGG